jgi:uncharacterized membrane protein YraQ (UPF0718 family)
MITAISLIIGLAIKKVKTTLSGIPARKKPKNNGMEAVPMAVIVGVPLYSDEVGVIPLVEAMLLKGVAVGTTQISAIIFLASVVAY